MKQFVFIFLTFSTSLVFSDTLTENFSTSQYFTSGSLVLNLTNGQLHPPLMIYQWQEAPAAATNTNINIGSGSNGEFTTTAHYATYSENGDTSGNIIRINTDTYSDLNFTQFTLQAGWTIRPTGSKPLILRVQGDVNIAGSINCNGSDGTDANISNLTMSSGGSGSCGGGNGGNGGTASSQPTNGSTSDDQSGSISGGSKAASLASTSGGGGGGGFTQPAYIAQDGYGPLAGTKGVSKLDGGFTIMGGGAGGGGGSANTRSGGGGGGGGGTIFIHAFGNITISGSLSANGGKGGSSTASASGSGGGGAGGSIWIFAGQNLTIDGTVTADNGSGGDSVNIGNHGDNGDGGHGASGRIWATDSLGGFGGAGSISPASGLTSDGQARFQTGSFTRASTIYDLLNYHIQFDSLTPTIINSSSGSFSATLEGSRRGFDLETTGAISSNSLSEIKNSRYIKMYLTLNNSSLTNPIKLDSLVLNYSPSSPTEFNYKSSGCGSIHNSQYGLHPNSDTKDITIFYLLLIILPLFVWTVAYYQLNSSPTPID